MLNWLRSLWSRDHSPKRLVFEYSDGTRTRRADPLAAFAAFESACPDFEEQLKALDEPTGVALPPGAVAAALKTGRADALKKLLAATRAAFGVKPLDDAGGLTEAETLQLLTRFFVWMGEAARDARPFSDSRPRASPVS